MDENVDIAEDEDEGYLTSEEASKVRKELNHLGFIAREVLIRYYFGNQGVADIAEGLGIPEGTVKSRLSAGRGQIKKGLGKIFSILEQEILKLQSFRSGRTAADGLLKQ